MIAEMNLSEFTTTEIVVMCIAALLALLIVVSTIEFLWGSVVAVFTGKAFVRERPPKLDPSLPDSWEVLSYHEREERRKDYDELFRPSARFWRYGRGCLFSGCTVLMIEAVAIITGRGWFSAVCETLELDRADTGQFALWAALVVGSALSLTGAILLAVFRPAPRELVAEWHEKDRKAKEEAFVKGRVAAGGTGSSGVSSPTP